MDWRQIEIFREENFEEKMEGIRPWLESTVREGYFYTTDALRLHYHYCIPTDSDDIKGTIVMVHGFCEFFGKYHEMAYYFYQAGYAFFFLEQRGHGFSDRLTENLSKVVVNSYEEYVQDFREFMHFVVRSKKPDGPMYLYSHSMGGMVSMLYLEKNPNIFDGAVLSSPMLAVNTGKIPDWLVPACSGVARLLRWEERYCPRQHDFDGVARPEISSASSIPRYMYQFKQRVEHVEYQTSGATYSWIMAGLKAQKILQDRAKLLETPVLMCRAGADIMVDMRGQEEFLRRRPDIRVVEFPDARHEIYNSTPENIQRYYKEIFTFFEELSEKTGNKAV